MDPIPAATGLDGGGPARFPKKLFLGLIILIILIIFSILLLKLIAQKKVVPYQQEQTKIDELVASVQAIDKPLDPDVGLGRLKSLKGQFEAHMKSAQALIAKGDMDGANLALLEAKRIVDVLGYGPKEERITDEEKQQHDPKDKYVKTDSADPRVRDIYLQMIGLLVATDTSY